MKQRVAENLNFYEVAHGGNIGTSFRDSWFRFHTLRYAPMVLDRHNYRSIITLGNKPLTW